MGYHVAITRDTHAQEIPISQAEWESFISNTPALVAIPPETQDKHTDIAAYLADDKDCWLAWSDGAIWAKTPDDKLMQFMIAAAQSLNARVRGDEGEYYRAPDDYYYETENGDSISPSNYDASRRQTP